MADKCNAVVRSWPPHVLHRAKKQSSEVNGRIILFSFLRYFCWQQIVAQLAIQMNENQTVAVEKQFK